MRDFSRIALLASLALLLLVIAGYLPRFDLFHGLGKLRDVLPWLLIGLLFLCFSGRCGCRGWGSCRRRSSPSEAGDQGYV